MNIKINLSNRALTVLLVFGALLIVIGVYVGFVVLPGIIVDKIWETKVLKENTDQWDMFMKTPFPLTFKVFFYDILNPDEILHGAKPKVRDVGPFVYKVYKWKDEIEWTSPEDISYNGYTRFEFDKEASGMNSEDTEITIVNILYLGVLLKIEATQPDAISMLADDFPAVFGDNYGIFIKVKVRDYLWNGLEFCKNEGAEAGFAGSMMCKQVIDKISESKNMRIVNKTVLFANLHYKNNTHQGRFTVKSGQKTKEEAGVLSLYNGNPYISTWPGDKSICNKIRGVTTVFPCNIKTDLVFDSFAEDICRHISLEYDSEETVKNVKGFKFVVKNNTFSSKLPDNSCFCTNKSKTFGNEVGCVKDGIMDMSPCTGGPIMTSFPHLLYADQEYLNSVEGLDPKKEKHQTFIILEPMSGLPLHGKTRIQFNLFLRPIKGVDDTVNITSALMPLLWVEESFIIKDKYIDLLEKNLFHTLSIMNLAKWSVIVLGGSCLLAAGLTLVYRQAP